MARGRLRRPVLARFRSPPTCAGSFPLAADLCWLVSARCRPVLARFRSPRTCAGSFPLAASLRAPFGRLQGASWGPRVDARRSQGASEWIPPRGSRFGDRRLDQVKQRRGQARNCAGTGRIRSVDRGPKLAKMRRFSAHSPPSCRSASGQTQGTARGNVLRSLRRRKSGHRGVLSLRLPVSSGAPKRERGVLTQVCGEVPVRGSNRFD